MENKSIYLITAFEIERDKFGSGYYKSQSYSAYFSNLKLIYNLLSGKNLKSYTTISRSIANNGNYSTDNLTIKFKEQKINCSKIIIRKLQLNTFYKAKEKKDTIDIEKLIIREFGLRNLLIGLDYAPF